MRANRNNQMRYKEPGNSDLVSAVHYITHEYILDHTESTFNAQSDKHMMKLRWKSRIDCMILDSHLSCDICTK